MSAPIAKVLITNCVDASLLNKFDRNHIAVTMHSWIKISHCQFDWQDNTDFLIVSSKNAVYAALNHPQYPRLKQIPVFCVGRHTASLLRLHGWKIVAWKDYAAELAQLICSQYRQYSFTALCGNLRRDTIAAALTEAGVNFKEIVVYQTVLTQHKITADYDGYCFFSPSAIKSFLINNSIDDKTTFCIGKTTAQELLNYNCQVIMAPYPSIEATLDACFNYIINHVKK